jgi:methylisocitrate lyase
LDAREDPDFLIIARTESLCANNDLEDSVRRVNAFSDAGADLVFIMGLTPYQLSAIRNRIPAKVVIVNTPPFTAVEESEAGADIVLYHTLCLYAASHSATGVLKTFKRTLDVNSVAALLDSQADFENTLGYRAFNDRAKMHGLN